MKQQSMNAKPSDNPSGSLNDDQENVRHPLIRKGQRKPYVKATHKQIELRIEAAALLSYCGYNKSQIHQIFRNWYGIEWRQTDRYMARAKANETPLSHAPMGHI